MPLYEYRCEECGHVTEFLEKPGTRERHVCEKCRSRKMTKLLSTFALGEGRPTAGAKSSCRAGAGRGFS